jgi:MoxR-like ATPase
VRLSAEAMNAALTDFQGLQYQTRVASAYDVFLAVKWADANPTGLGAWHDVPLAVQELFVLFPHHELGRLKPCRYDWLTVADSGRKTVWNNNTRGNKLSTTLLNGQDIRNGLLPNASQILGQALPANRPSRQSLAALVLRGHDFAPGDDWPQAEAELLTRLGMSLAELQDITSPNSLGVPLLGPDQWDETTIPDDLRPPEAHVVQAPAAAAAPAAPVVPGAGQVAITVDARVERMLRLAVATTASILLVGPPGTGKGTLLNWLLGELATDPEQWGFEVGFDPNPMWRTPDESWSAFELVGGLAPVATGQLAWSSGALLDAIANDRWLILDETNRGDMDKIMGPLLTWLSEQEVEVGTTLAHQGKPISIGWGDARASLVDDQGATDRYLAGTDFRLLGTYNPQDAQRVFRFGQALSRRFVVIPVPAVRPGQFTQILEGRYPDLPEDAVDALTGLYRAHFADEVTTLGPAVFLRMANYISAGLPASVGAGDGEDQPGAEEAAGAPGGAAALEDGRAADGGHAPETEAEVADAEAGAEGALVDGDEAEGDQGEGDQAGDGASDPAVPQASPLLDELLAEAYVTGVGRYLAGFEDRIFQALGERVMNDEAVLPQGQWAWVSSQRNVLS